MKKQFKAVILSLLLTFSVTVPLLSAPFDSYAEEQSSAAKETDSSSLDGLLGSVPRYYNTYCTEESSSALSALLEKYNKYTVINLSDEEMLKAYDELSSAIEKLQYRTSQVPQVYITTNDNIGNQLIKETGYIPTHIAVVDTDGNTVSQNGIIKVRGNSTAMVYKKPYTFKFETKQDLLGMGKGKRWVLLADCLDPTFMRNYVAFEIGKELGIDYTSEHRFTEVWMDGVYKGCYELTEPVSEGKNRVDIDVDSNNGMNDFLIQYEYSRAHEDSIYFTADDLRFEIKSPDVTSEEQRLYVKNKTIEIYKVIKSLDYDEISKVIDTRSFAAYYLLNEYYKPVDVGFSSIYFYYTNGKLFAGPPWDYDLAAGNLNYSESENSRLCLDTTGLFASQYLFYKYLCQCDEFIDEVRHIYREHYDFFENIYAENGLIDTVSSEYREVFDRNYEDTDWDISFQYLNLMRPPDKTYEENFEYLRDWYKNRNEWYSEYLHIFDLDNIIPGDLDESGEVNIADAVLLNKHLLSESKLTQTQYTASDINNDGKVNAFDMVLMRKLVINNNKQP